MNRELRIHKRANNARADGNQNPYLNTGERMSASDPYFDDDQHTPRLPSRTERMKRKSTCRRRHIPTENESRRLLKKAIQKDVEEELEFGRAWRITRRMKPLGFSQRHLLRILNPWSGKVWAAMVEEGLDSLGARSGAYFVTILCEDWDFESDHEWRSSDELLERFRIAQRTIRNHLRDVDFLLQLDVGLHRYAHSRGRRVCVHFHGFVWGPRASVRQAMERFKSGYSGAKGGQAKLVRTWLKTVRYVTKDTRTAYVSFKRGLWNPDRARPRLFSYREPLTRQNRRFLLDLFGSLTKPELCLGSGRGSQILRHARQLAAERGWQRSR